MPATASVPLIVKLRESAYRPPAFVMGAHGAHAVMEGDCAPSYLEVWLAPLAAYRLLGLPMDAIGGQTVDLTDLLGPAGRRLAEQLPEAPTGGNASRCWTSSCCGGWTAGHSPRPRSPGHGGAWWRPAAPPRSASSPARWAGATGT